MFMKKLVSNLIFTLLIVGNGMVTAEEIKSCLQLPSRTAPCHNTIYRGVTDPNTNQKIIFCFCKTDIASLFDERVDDAQKVLNQMEWRELVASSGYTEQQLIKLISR